jgi:hypothetical protein
MATAEEIAHQINDSIIPAEPGYKLVIFAGKPDDDEFDSSVEDAVIAWRIDPQKYGSRKPVTVSALEDEADYVILCPDGKIIGDQTSFNNIEAWETAARKYWAERRARHLAKSKEEANSKVEA